ncbi:hypothetical protein PROFUN_11297 [Planoprotostelium fungivorum]|uniref:SET domain-containing protein n=1 Tax=Planoprotostelium fungivorum TaxID=1890364 RepID=A0A2P6N2J1_9EUKA|nr:hypothetical protein PROFUN_11297 [Planoprotostelium fungivorum]
MGFTEYVAGFSDRVAVQSVDGDRILIAQRDFQPGEEIFSESPVLHTSHRIAQSSPPSPLYGFALDWQRLVSLYVHLRNQPNEEGADLLEVLSTDGVTGKMAQEVDPERKPFYREEAEQWCKDYIKKSNKSKNKKSKNQKDTVKYRPKVEDIERLIQQFETNCHSRSADPDPSAGDIVKKVWSVAGGIDDEPFMSPQCIGSSPTGRYKHHSKVYSDIQLSLRCIRTIKQGESVTISYHDQEMMSNDDRSQLIKRRGFNCRCPLCSGEIPDYARAMHCPSCEPASKGYISPRSGSWSCYVCSRKFSVEEAQKAEKKEEEMRGESQDKLEDGKVPFIALISQIVKFYRQRLQSLDPRSFCLASLVVELQSNVNNLCSPLHVSHGILYDTVKTLVFEMTPTLRALCGEDSTYLLLFYLLGSTFLLFRLNPDDPLLSDVRGASEEVRHLMYWMSQEGGQRKEQRDKDVGEWAQQIWKRHLQIFCP